MGLRYFVSLLTLILPGCVCCGQAQQDWDAFGQRIDVTSYQGSKFRVEAAVRARATDSSAEAEIWARVDKKGKKMGFFYNMTDKPIRINEWKIYSIEGKIDEGAEWLNTGGVYQRNGVYGFDNFKLSIENKRGEWTTIPLVDPSFEEDADSVNKAWIFFHNRPGFAKDISGIDAYDGKKYLEITGKGFLPRIQYGNNSAAGNYAEVNGIQLYYETYGTGAPLLLLHGNRSPISSFENQIPEFSKHFKVIAVDTRGQGKSSEDGKTYSYDLFAEDMNAFLDYLKLDSVDIVGWSDGGNTGLIMAMKYPAKVRRLVTMGADVFIDTSVVENWVFKEVKKQLRAFKKDTSYNSRNQWRLANLLITEPRHTFNDLKSIRCPVLVMAGEKDVIKENHTRGIAANITNSTLMIVPKETHYFPVEDARLFNKLVINFLTGQPGE